MGRTFPKNITEGPAHFVVEMWLLPKRYHIVIKQLLISNRRRHTNIYNNKNIMIRQRINLKWLNKKIFTYLGSSKCGKLI